jgi:hypothetical protein
MSCERLTRVSLHFIIPAPADEDLNETAERWMDRVMDELQECWDQYGCSYDVDEIDINTPGIDWDSLQEAIDQLNEMEDQ